MPNPAASIGPLRSAQAPKRIFGYESWYVFETKHSSPEQCVEATRKNIGVFMRRCLA